MMYRGSRMNRTQIQLTSAQAGILKELAARENKSMAEIIRQCIERYVVGSAFVDDSAKYRRALSAVGKFRSGKKDISVEHDRYLSEAFHS